MPINSRHPEYDITESTRVEDAYDGDVKKPQYVPRLKNQSSRAYLAYINRGVYVNSTRRTVDGMVGLALRKQYTLDDQLDENEILVDGDIDFSELVATSLRNVITDARSCLLIDTDDSPEDTRIIQYDRKQLINWRTDRTLFVIEECYYVPNPDDQYKLEEQTQYRELYIDQDGYYAQRVWRNEIGSVYQVVQTFEPTIRGQRLTEIPFVVITPYDNTLDSYDPVVKSLADVNISHFASSVDLEHGSHLTALPTPYVAGDLQNPDQQNIQLGGEQFLLLKQGAQTGFIEYTGAGIGTIRENMKNKEEQMAYLGATLLTGKKGVESAEAMRIRSTAESAILVNVVNSTEKGIKKTLDWYYRFSKGASPESEVDMTFDISKDFDTMRLSPAELKQLVETYQGGSISLDTFLEQLERGEIIHDRDEERLKLEKNIGTDSNE